MSKPKLDRAAIEMAFPSFSRLNDPTLQDNILAVWGDLFERSSWDRLEDACFDPEAPSSRLVDHVNVVTEGTLAVSECIERYHGTRFNTQTIIALGLLHDVSKLVEYEPDCKGTAKKSEIGEKIQHGVMGAMCCKEHGFDTEFLHLILTHTPMSKIDRKSVV